LNYLDLANQGNNSLKRYIAGIFTIIGCWLVGGALVDILFIIVLWLIKGIHTNIVALVSEPIVKYIMLNLVSLCLFIGVVIATRYIHKRSVHSLITTEEYINWRKLLIGFAIYGILALFGSLVEYFIEPNAFHLSLSFVNFIIFLPIALVVTLVQATGEELVFRGYILQGLSRINRNPIILSIISGILFTLPHINNPEVSASPIQLLLYYFCFGFILALITIKSNGLEIAIGAHTANNLICALIISYKNSVLPNVSSIIHTERFNPTYNLISFIVIALILYWILFNYLKLDKHARKVPVIQLSTILDDMIAGGTITSDQRAAILYGLKTTKKIAKYQLYNQLNELVMDKTLSEAEMKLILNSLPMQSNILLKINGENQPISQP
jgi:membrane protease YdiL (CAAX protease family)